MSPRTVLPLSNPALRAALRDLKLLGHWEHLRRTRRVMTTAEFATACGIDLSAAQSGLDLLVESGLVVTLRATKSRKGIAYRAVANEVLISYSLDSQEQKEAAHAYMCIFSDESRGVIDRNDTVETRGMPGLAKFRGHQSFTLTKAEAESIAQALRNAWQFITQVEMLARERAAAGHAKRGQRKDAVNLSEDAEEHPYHVALEFRPLKTAELPICDIGAWEKKALAKELAYLTRSPAAVLTPREQQIARRLSDGESRPEVAKALGVTVNTINSATKRIYTKLGVRNRAEFTARMKSG